jgi:glyoxylase-like metal-dependent hydrolase (beta-lactamase superfamily II)
LVALLALPGLVWADTAEVPVTLERLTPRVLLVRSGDVYPDQIAVLVARRGLVVVDTGISPTLTQRYRAAVEAELGRSDFAYVINTHHHFDHTNGNQVFAGAAIVAHENAPAAMRAFARDVEGFVTARRARYERRAALAKGLAPGSKMAGRLRDLVHMSRHACDDLESRFRLTLPSLTFTDRLTLHLGDLTLRLYHFGKGLHTDNDVVVHVPEEGLVFTGDLLRAHGTLSAVTGAGELDRWVDTLASVIADPATVQHVVTIHAGVLGPERLVSLHDSLVGIRDAVKTKASAAAELERAVRQGGEGAARQRLGALLGPEGDRFYLLEGELSALGYRLLEESRVDEALAVFRLNAEAFPDSAEAHDALGEACMAAGAHAAARIAFERSLEIDPLDSYAFDMIGLLHARDTASRP